MQLRKLLFRNSRSGKNNYLSPEDFLNRSRMLHVTWFWNKTCNIPICGSICMQYINLPGFAKYSLYIGTISNLTENAVIFVAIYLLCKVFLKPVISVKTEAPT